MPDFISLNGFLTFTLSLSGAELAIAIGLWRKRISGGLGGLSMNLGRLVGAPDTQSKIMEHSDPGNKQGI